MPAGYEYDLDHGVIDAAAWDHVTLDDLEHYLAEASLLPNDLRGAVEYLDLSEVLSLQISYVGALQLAPWYEGLIDRGIKGSVIYAPDPSIHDLAGTVIATCSVVGGGLPEGYRLTRNPVALSQVHHFLEEGCRTAAPPTAQVA